MDNQKTLVETDTGEYETMMLADAYVSESEFNVIQNSLSEYTTKNNIPDEKLTKLLERMRNYKNCVGTQNKEKTYRIRCMITDVEMDLLNQANNKMNPASSRSVSYKIQNSMMPVENLYKINMNISKSLKEKLDKCDETNILADNTNITVTNTGDTMYTLNVFVTQFEFDMIYSLKENNSMYNEVKEFVSVLPQITQKVNK